MKWKQIGGLGAILAAIAVALSQGNKPPTTKPDVPAPVIDTTSAIVVRLDDRSRVPNLSCGLQLDRLPTDADNTPSIPCEYIEDSIQVKFTIPAGKSERGGYLTVGADQFENQTVRVIVHSNGLINDENDLPFEIAMNPSVRPLPGVRARGQWLELQNGDRWTYIGATDFNLLARYVHGEDITPILKQRSEIGFNVLRIFTAFNVCPDSIGPDGKYCQPIGRLYPDENYYSQVKPFLRQLARYGLYAELVGFAGKWDQGANNTQMVAHWNNLLDAVCQDNPYFTFVELANEYDHPANAGVPLELMNFRRCENVLFSNASAVQDSTPRLPVQGYATYRPGSGPEWMRKVAHNGMEDVADKFHVPTVANETTRFPDNANNPDQAFDAAAGAALLSAGSTFHSVRGKNSALFEPLEVIAGQAWVRGAKSVPFACQGQPYFRIDDFSFLRVYRRGNDPQCLVKIRR